jgi:hypothetical protein
MVELDSDGCWINRIHPGGSEGVVVLVCEHILPGVVVYVRDRDQAIRVHRGLNRLHRSIYPERSEVDEGTPREPL